jgi:hypothetical protein
LIKRLRSGILGATGVVTEFAEMDMHGIPGVVFVKFAKYFGKPFHPLKNHIPILRHDIPEHCSLSGLSWTRKQFPLQVSAFNPIQIWSVNNNYSFRCSTQQPLTRFRV